LSDPPAKARLRAATHAPAENAAPVLNKVLRDIRFVLTVILCSSLTVELFVLVSWPFPAGPDSKVPVSPGDYKPPNEPVQQKLKTSERPAVQEFRASERPDILD
jgi:hypothetical protein